MSVVIVLLIYLFIFPVVERGQIVKEASPSLREGMNQQGLEKMDENKVDIEDESIVKSEDKDKVNSEAQVIGLEEKSPNARPTTQVVCDTTKGSFRVNLNTKYAPLTVAHFLRMVR